MTPEEARAIEILKASGDIEPFSEEKLLLSLREGAGASPDLARAVLRDLRPRIRPGISTRELYRLAFNLLRKAERGMAARYSLKHAIMSLGPSGFPFEKLVGRILELRGYRVRTGVTLAGRCVSHEVDVVGEKDGRRILVECKFHNRLGIKNDVKTALYVRARALDLLGPMPRHDEFWLVTNTKFTSEAVRYAQCSGLKIIGWDYPSGSNLRQLVERSGAHPVTCLTSLSNVHKKELLARNRVLCQELVENPQCLAEVGLKEAQVRRVLEEIHRLTESPSCPAS